MREWDGRNGGVCVCRFRYGHYCQASVCASLCKYAGLDVIASKCVRERGIEKRGRVTFGRCHSLGYMCISGLMFM